MVLAEDTPEASITQQPIGWGALPEAEAQDTGEQSQADVMDDSSPTSERALMTCDANDPGDG